MYNLYFTECEVQGVTPVKESFYRNIFSRDFNLKFHAPRSDTCKKCEELKMNIATARNEEEKGRLRVKHELHHRKVESACSALAADTKKAKEDAKVHCISFDLQQTPNTPKLPVGETYYLRQLNTHNFGVVDCASLDGFMYVWNEIEGKFKYIETIPHMLGKTKITNCSCSG